MSFSSGVVPGHVNEILLEATQIQGSGIISIEEVINGVDVVLSQVQVQPGQQVSQLLTVVPSTTSVKIKFKYLGVSWKWYGKKICVKVPQMQSETYLVDVCDEVGDKYRFGFNGQEKVNEMAGIGNHIDFKFRGYDPRIGRFWAVDPLARMYPWNSVYAFAENNVIEGVDLEGAEYKSTRSHQFGVDNTAVQIIDQEQVEQRNQYNDPMNTMIRNMEENPHTLRRTPSSVELMPEYQRFKANYNTFGEYLPGPSDIVDGLSALNELSKGDYKSAGAKALFLIPGADIFKPLLTKKDIQGALKDIAGKPVVINGKTYNHLQEVEEALSGVGKQLNNLGSDIDAGKFTDEVLEQAKVIRSTLQKQKDKLNDVLNEAKNKK